MEKIVSVWDTHDAYQAVLSFEYTFSLSTTIRLDSCRDLYKAVHSIKDFPGFLVLRVIHTEDETDFDLEYFAESGYEYHIHKKTVAQENTEPQQLELPLGDC